MYRTSIALLLDDRILMILQDYCYWFLDKCEHWGKLSDHCEYIVQMIMSIYHLKNEDCTWLKYDVIIYIVIWFFNKHISTFSFLLILLLFNSSTACKPCMGQIKTSWKCRPYKRKAFSKNSTIDQFPGLQMHKPHNTSRDYLHQWQDKRSRTVQQSNNENKMWQGATVCSCWAMLVLWEFGSSWMVQEEVSWNRKIPSLHKAESEEQLCNTFMVCWAKLWATLTLNISVSC